MTILPVTPGDVPGADSEGRRTQAGDSAGDEALALQSRRWAYVLALQLLGNADQARDVAQEAMLRFYASQDQFDRRRPVKPWLLQIVRNHVRDLWRHRRVAESPGSTVQSVDLVEQLAEPGPNPEECAGHHELRRQVWLCLSRLRAGQREILVLRDYHDLSYRQIAGVLGIPMGTVMSRLHQARKELRSLLAADGAPTPPASTGSSS
jgi:RNA polymerase sigma-70 factor (ECF subfamily)